MLHTVGRKDAVLHAGRRADLVTMGINPTRPQLHPGHYLTLYQLLRLVNARDRIQAVIFVDDREHHSRQHEDGNKSVFPLVNPHNTGAITDTVADFVSQTADAFADATVLDRVKIVPMSAHMREADPATGEPRGADLFRLLRHHRALIEHTLELGRGHDQPGCVCGACPGCLRANRDPALVTLSAAGIDSVCHYEQCPVTQFCIDPVRGDDRWTMHYTADPLRDALLADEYDAERTLHVFGGDYGMPYGTNITPKAQRLTQMIPAMTTRRIDHFVGPLLTRNGEKLSKSNGDAGQAPPYEWMELVVHSGQAMVEMPHAG